MVMMRPGVYCNNCAYRSIIDCLIIALIMSVMYVWLN